MLNQVQVEAVGDICEALAKMRKRSSKELIDQAYAAVQRIMITDIRAREAIGAKARGNKYNKSAEPIFTLEWRATGGEETITGWPALAKRLGWKQSTCSARLSSGKGVASIAASNPAMDGELDTLTIRHTNRRPRKSRRD